MRSVNVLLLLMLFFHEMKSACKYILLVITTSERARVALLVSVLCLQSARSRVPLNFW